MPSAPLRDCSFAGCRNKVKQGRCALHERGWGGGLTAEQRGYGKGWRITARQVIKEEPVCRYCRTNPSTECDHIIPRAEGGTDERSNLCGACAPCHAKKTAEERKRGVQRARRRRTA